MRTSTQLSCGLVVATLLFAASFSVAQSTQSSAAQRKDGSIVHADFPRSTDRSSANATESLSPSNKADTVKNPLYKDDGKSGVNPLFEGKDKATIKPVAKTSNVQGYKDPEDMTTRYRPGNNKTTRTVSTNKTSTTSGAKIK